MSPLSLRRYSVENKGNNICILFNLLTSFVCLGVVDCMHTLIHTHLCNSSEMRWSLNIFPPFESGLSLWFTLTCAMQQKWQNRTSEILFLSALWLLLLPSWDMSILTCSGVANSFETLWTVAHQAPLSMEFFRQKYWSEFFSFRGSSLPRDWTCVSCVSYTAGGFFTLWATGNAYVLPASCKKPKWKVS